MSKSKILYYFTNSYPYGMAEEWKRRELQVYVDYFDKIVVVPYWYAGNRNARPFLHTKIEYLQPIFQEKETLQIRKKLVSVLKSMHLLFFLREFFRAKVFLDKQRLIRWIFVSFNISTLFNSSIFKSIFAEANDVTCYFFWGRESSEVVPLIPARIKVICKFYNYDLYQNIWGYLPYQRNQMERANYIVACSQDNKKYILKNYPQVAGKVLIDYLGTELPKSFVESSSDGVFRLVSCSFMVPHKRLEIIANCLSFLDFPVHWTHIGDGALRAEFERRLVDISSKKTNIKAFFIGNIPTQELTSFYLSQPFDLFVNTSSTEGIPISIMEVMSLKIPALATNVGGLAELLVDGVNGFLVPKSVDPESLAGRIAFYAGLDASAKQRIRENARKTIEVQFDSNICARDLANKVFT